VIAAGAVGLAALPACGTGHGGTSYCATVARVVTAGIRIIVGRGPSAIAITPDGARAYVADGFDGTVTPIRLATGTPGPPIKVAQGPVAIAITPDGAIAYVASISEDPGRRYVPRPGVVTPIRLATGIPGTPIKVGRFPYSIAITPDGTTAYVANNVDSTVTPIRLATGTPGTPIKVAYGPIAIAIAPDGQTAYVTSAFTDVTKGPFTPRPGEVTPIRLATGTPGRPMRVGRVPAAIALTPDGAKAWVTALADGTITPIRLATGTPGTPVTVGSNPAAIAITPDGATAYVVDYADGTVTPVELAAGTPRTPIKVPLGPHSIAITPDGKIAYVASVLVTPSLRGLHTAPPGMVTPICLPSSK
jgi:DNA-binding beta-propeller fold protein YncE